MQMLSKVRRHVGVIAASVAPLLVVGVFAMPWAHATGTSTISGSVWNDANRNGIFDSGEAPFANVPIWVYSGTTYVSGATTDSNGNYHVAGLADGTYTVEIAAQTWNPMRDNWVPTTTGSGQPAQTVSLAGTATSNFGLRQVVRSTSMSSPITTYQGPNGLVANSYDDVVTALALYNDVTSVQLKGPEAGATTLYFDSPSTTTDTVSSAAGGPPAQYSNFHASMYVTYDSWVTGGDEILVHEYGHAWSNYNAYISQQDPNYTSYLQARGLTGNPNLGTSWMWEPSELIAEDYRQLFGTPNAMSYPQANTQIPPAANVWGLRSFLQNTYDVAPATSSTVAQTSPSVSSLSPATVPAAGGTTVTVTGSNFSGSGWTTTGVHVGTMSAPFSLLSANELSVVVPAGTGQQDLTVTTSANGSPTSPTSSNDVVTYVPVPTVTSIGPTSGSFKGGTSVTVYGSGFSGTGYTVKSVSFGGSAGSKVVVLSPTELTVVNPSGSGTVDITVTTSGGSSAKSVYDQFTYKKR